MGNMIAYPDTSVEKGEKLGSSVVADNETVHQPVQCHREAGNS